MLQTPKEALLHHAQIPKFVLQGSPLAALGEDISGVLSDIAANVPEIPEVEAALRRAPRLPRPPRLPRFPRLGVEGPEAFIRGIEAASPFKFKGEEEIRVKEDEEEVRIVHL